MLRLLGLACTVVMIILLVGCVSGKQDSPTLANPPMPTNSSISVSSSPELIPATETALSTDTPVPPFGTPTAIPIIASNGLGAIRDVWEEQQGTPIRVTGTYQGAESPVYSAELQVTFDARRVIVSIAKDYTGKELVSLDVAKAQSLKLIPSDAVLTRHFDYPTINPEGPGGIEPLVLVDLYNSKSLSTLFPPEVWFVEEPGTFYIEYEQYASKGNQIGAFLMELSSPP